MAFEWYDWLIFATFLSSGIIIATIIKFTSKIENTDDFVLAGRSLSWFPVTISLFASFTSAITLISTPADIYQNNIDYFWIVIPWLIGAVLTAKTFFSLFYKMLFGSSYEYLERRFGNDMIKRMVSGVYVVFALISMGIALYFLGLKLKICQNSILVNFEI